MSVTNIREQADKLWRVAGLESDRSETSERHLAAVTTAAVQRSRWRDTKLFAGIIAAAIIVIIFAAQLGLSIAVSEGAYEKSALQLEERDLIRVERVLSQNVDKLASPQNLADNAGALGMVQNSNPATLRLSDNVVLGDLAQRTSQVEPNLVPNATLNSLPMVDAEGLMVAREGAAAPAPASSQPVIWEGVLPAPDTH